LGGWYGGLLEPAVDTRGKSYAEFVVEDPGEHKEYQGRSCRMGIGATALLEAPDGPSISGGPANISQGWMYYCNDSSIWPEPGLWSARCAWATELTSLFRLKPHSKFKCRLPARGCFSYNPLLLCPDSQAKDFTHARACN
jgi:hypothetical protein